MRAPRTCSLCGTVYDQADTITRCTEIQSGTYCGGEVLPPPAAAPRAARCLVCMDEREVEILGVKQPCPRLVIPGTHGEL